MCVEVCTNCTLPATSLAGATRVVAKNSCATATPANSWRMVPRLFTDSVWFVQFQNLGNGHCLTTDNSTAVPYCERGPYRGLHSSERVLLGCDWHPRRAGIQGALAGRCTKPPSPRARLPAGFDVAGYRVLGAPCLTYPVAATTESLAVHPQLYRVNNDRFDGSYLNLMATMQAPNGRLSTCLTTCL